MDNPILDNPRYTEEVIDFWLAKRGKVAIYWSIGDVLEVRPDLSEEDAYEVLWTGKRKHNAIQGFTWDHIREVADELFPKPSKRPRRKTP